MTLIKKLTELTSLKAGWIQLRENEKYIQMKTETWIGQEDRKCIYKW